MEFLWWIPTVIIVMVMVIWTIVGLWAYWSYVGENFKTGGTDALGTMLIIVFFAAVDVGLYFLLVHVHSKT
jgi:hypothetical protein